MVNREDEFKEMHDTLKALLKYNSVKAEPVEDGPNGKEVKECLEEALKIAASFGFKTKNVGGHAGFAEMGEGEDYVAVLGHLDIVPAGDDWKNDPFSGSLVDGKIYGRGTNDDKGPMVAALYALKDLKDQGVELGSRVRIIFGTSEETGGPDIEEYLKVEGQPKAGFTPDAGFPVINAEKGIVNISLKKQLNTGDIKIKNLEGGNAPNMVPDRSRALIIKDDKEIEYKEKGISAHGSTPEKGDNAILKIFEKLASLNPQLKREMETLINSLKDTKGRGMGIILSDEPSGDLSMNLGMANFENGVLDLVLNFRVPVSYSLEDLVKPIKECMEPLGYEVIPGAFTPPLYYPKDLPLVKTLMEVYRDFTKDEKSEAIAIGGGTYAKSINNIVAFGPGFPHREEVDHIADEHIYKEDFLLWKDIFKEAVKKTDFFINREALDEKGQ